MSDFLQFVDRVPTLPNRKKITHADSSVEYATVEYADEPIETGTPLNKANFEKLNRILGYGTIVGTYNPTTENVEYNYPYFNENNLIDNMRVLVKGGNNPKGPATDFTIVKNRTSFDYNFSLIKCIKMSNGNIMAVGCQNRSSNNYNGFIAILDQQGNIVKTSTSIGTYFYAPQLIEMSNKNIMIVGCSLDTSSPGYIIILDQQGNIIKSKTSIGQGFANAQLIEMTNGNIMIVGCKGSSYGQGVMAILNQQGTVVKASTTISNYSGYPQLIEMSNGNIMIIGYNSNNRNLSIRIVSQSGTSIYSNDVSRTFSNPQLMEMSNGNIMIVGADGSYAGYILILDQSGNTIKDFTSVGLYYSYPQLMEMSNGNIMIVGVDLNTSGMGGSYTYDCYRMVLDQQGNIVKSSSKIANYMNYPQLIEMSNGNIFVTSYSSSGSHCKVAILDKQGNLVLSAKELTSSAYEELIPIELDNDNIMILGQVNWEGEFVIIEPTGASANCTINNVNLDTMIKLDEYYELVYNETLNKFIAEEVRNAN